MSTGALRQLSSQKYISLETYRRSGAAVRTPVWFVETDGVLYVYSLANAGKVKRLRGNPRARVAVCNGFGHVKGEWFEAEARIVSGDEEQRGQELLRRKYRPWKTIGDFFSRLRGRRQAILAIRMR